MTKQEFMRQIWRPYDTVEIEGGIVARVINVCFPTRSVRIQLDQNTAEWIECDMIVKHNSATEEPDDIAVIGELHKRLMAANKRNEDLQFKLMQEREKSEKYSIKELRKCVNILNASFVQKKETMEKIEESIELIYKFISKNEDVD